MSPDNALFPPPPDNDPQAQATYWLTLLTSGLASEEQRRAFRIWLAAAPAHRAAWKEAEKFWHQLDRLAAIPSVAADASPRRHRRRPAGAARHWAAAVLLLGVALWVHASPWLYADYATAAGEGRTVDLADGSQLQLNTRTALSFEHSGTRRLTLHQGEVFVRVSADPAHPFEVDTPAGTVRALGTAFEVRLADDGAVVTVYEHAVRVSPTRGEALASLEQGQRAAFSGERVAGTETVDLERSSAWRRNRLVFQDRPLAQVVEELNRYRRFPMIVADPRIGALPVSGVFDTRDTDAALAMIENSLTLGCLRLPGGWALLYAV